jgi:hypothetical protein
MSEPDNFLERWSKRKLAGSDAVPPQADEPPAPSEDKNAAAAQLAQDVVTPGEENPFDITSLPPIESIDANTDITGFLRPGVPPEVSRAALRRAWSADPAIRDFVGLVENGWDFNDPNAMAGFGPIEPAEVARLAAQMLGQLPASDGDAPEAAKTEALGESNAPESAPQATSADPPKPNLRTPEGAGLQRNVNVAAQKEPDP